MIESRLMDDCMRAGMAGHCGTEQCDALMDYRCDIQHEFDPELLYELGLIEDLPKSEQEQAYERAMEMFK